MRGSILPDVPLLGALMVWLQLEYILTLAPSLLLDYEYGHNILYSNMPSTVFHVPSLLLCPKDT